MPQDVPMRALISATVLALALTACGGGGDDDESTPTPSKTTEASAASTSTTAASKPTTEATAEEPALDPVETVQAWSDAYGIPDGAAACALQSEAYTKADLKSGIEQGIVKEGASCEEGVVAGYQFGKSMGFDTAGGKATPISESGDKAKVNLTLPGLDPQTYNVVLVDGKWLVDGEVDDN